MMNKEWINKNVKQIRKKIDIYQLLIFLLVILAFVLRFYNFPVRWGLGGDDARDALIALEALKRQEIPLMGPFSSAGAFVTGGVYYWFIMVSYLIFPFLFSPWVISGILGVLTVFIFIKIGEILGGRTFAIIIGLLSATSPQLIVRSISLNNPSFVIITTILTIYFFIRILENKKWFHAFLTGFFIGLAINFHYQAINLLIFLPLLLFIPKFKLKKKIYLLIFAFVGLLTPNLPLLYWDYFQNFANLRNIFDYFLIAQNRIYIPNSWKLFLFKEIPAYWAYVEGYFVWLSLLIFLSSAVFFIYLIVRKKVSVNFIFLGAIFLLLLFINRFYKGERSEGYLLYFAPFILILSTLLISNLVIYKDKLIQIFGILFLSIVILANLIGLKPTYNYKSPVGELKNISYQLHQKFPNTNFSLYNERHWDMDTALAASLVLDFNSQASLNGRPLGITCKGCLGERENLVNSDIKILDLNRQKKLLKNDKIWLNVNKETVYESQIGWLKRHNLKSTFSIRDYIMEKVHPVK